MPITIFDAPIDDTNWCKLIYRESMKWKSDRLKDLDKILVFFQSNLGSEGCWALVYDLRTDRVFLDSARPVLVTSFVLRHE